MSGNQDWIINGQETDEHITSVRARLDDDEPQSLENLLGDSSDPYGEDSSADEDYLAESVSNLYGGQENQGFLGGLKENQQKVIIIGTVGALLLLSLLILFGLNPLGFLFSGDNASKEPSPEEAPSDPGAGQNKGGAEGGAEGGNASSGTSSVGLPADQIPLTDSGVTFEPPVEEDGKYLLTAGDVSWGGERSNSETGPTLTLEGPTAAQVKRSLTFKGGDINTSIFGRTAPDKPLQHATGHQILINGGEKTSGTFYEVDGEKLVSMGAYFDYRDGDSVTRTYVEMDPDSAQGGIKDVYATTFDSPLPKDKQGNPTTDEGPPIPTLVGLHADQESTQ